MNIVILVTGKTSLSRVWLTVEETITRPVLGIFIQAEVSTCFERFFSSNDFRDRRDRSGKVRVFKVCKAGGWQVANAYTPPRALLFQLFSTLHVFFFAIFGYEI